jgi:hypothetical protein
MPKVVKKTRPAISKQIHPPTNECDGLAWSRSSCPRYNGRYELCWCMTKSPGRLAPPEPLVEL